jgi:hypothetical protein
MDMFTYDWTDEAIAMLDTVGERVLALIEDADGEARAERDIDAAMEKIGTLAEERARHRFDDSDDNRVVPVLAEHVRYAFHQGYHDVDDQGRRVPILLDDEEEGDWQ